MDTQEILKKLVSEEVNYFEYLLSITAIIFAIIGNGGHDCDNSSSFYLIHCLMEAFSKSFLTEVMSFLTWKLIFWNRAGEGTRGKQAMYLAVLTGIHVLWVYLTNICFSCMSTNIEAGAALVEFLILIVMMGVIVKWACTACCQLCSTLETETPPTPTPRRDLGPRQVHTLTPQRNIPEDLQEECQQVGEGPQAAGDTAFYQHTCGKANNIHSASNRPNATTLLIDVEDSDAEPPSDNGTTETNHRMSNLTSAVRFIESRTRSGAIYSRKKVEALNPPNRECK